MKRITEKRERSLGVKLFIKADRCNSPKCVMVRRPSRPGAHGKRRMSLTDYGRQLQEKQKIQAFYGLNNQQMRRLFQGQNLEKVVKILFHRLDYMVYLSGLARSPRIARQLVSHGHITVNGRKVTISSYQVRKGDVISIRDESRGKKVFEDIHARMKQYDAPEWLKIDKEKLQGACVKEVTAEDVQFPFDIDVVGQFYSR